MQVPQLTVRVHLHEQGMSVQGVTVFGLHKGKPQFSFIRYQVNGVVHWVVPSEGKVLREPVWEGEGSD